jgi:hypothetical protein
VILRRWIDPSELPEERVAACRARPARARQCLEALLAQPGQRQLGHRWPAGVDGERMPAVGELLQVRRRASWPLGRVLCTRSRGPAAIHLGLPLLTASCGLPASIGRAALKHSRSRPKPPFLTLLRMGFTKPLRSPRALVVSYPTGRCQ